MSRTPKLVEIYVRIELRTKKAYVVHVQQLKDDRGLSLLALVSSNSQREINTQLSINSKESDMVVQGECVKSNLLQSSRTTLPINC